MAGEVAEALLLDGEPTLASDDRRQANELAQLVCKSPAAVTAFLVFCRQQAVDLLSEHVTLLMSLQIILRARRIVSGTELDQAIATLLAEEAAAIERQRRKKWNARIERARQFNADAVERAA